MYQQPEHAARRFRAQDDDVEFTIPDQVADKIEAVALPENEGDVWLEQAADGRFPPAPPQEEV
jgi:hypothetical protein